MIWSICLLLLASCQEEDSLRLGSLQLVLTDDSEQTRSLPMFSDEMTGQFQVSVYSQADAKHVFQGTCAELNASPLLLKAGAHTVQASYGDNPELALDAPYYLSEAKTVDVVGGKTQTVSLVCTVGNALASFELTNPDKLNRVLKDYYIEAVVSSQAVQWRLGDATHLYFKAGSTVAFYLKGTWIENEQVYSKKFAEVTAAKAGYIYKYKLGIDASGMTGAVFDIQVEEQAEPVRVEETIPQDFLPAPKLSATGFDEINQLVYTETEDNVAATISYASARPLQDMELTVEFADPNIAPLNGKYTLSQLTPELLQKFEQVGIILPDGKATKGSVVVNTASLVTVDSGADTENRLSLRVKSNDRWSGDAHTYTIRTKRPVFTVKALPEHAWSKEFTVEQVEVTAGKLENLQKQLVYQYSADNGATWHACSNERKQAFPSHPEQKNYQVRALYRGKLASNHVAVRLESPVQMPNSDMEEWHYTKVARSINTYKPWSSGGNSFWETNNSYTTRYVSNVGIFNAGSNPYNCFPAVSYVVGNAHKGNRAVEIRSTPAGRGNTLPSNVLNLNKVAGELFTGNVDVTMGGTAAVPNGDHYTIDETGRSFTVRPTALQFWYKYAPLNSDSFRARIVLLDAQKQKIVEKELTVSTSTSTWTQETVQLDYADNTSYAKCAYIYVVFSSTVNAGPNMPYQEYYDGYSLWEDDRQVLKNDSRTWIGSILTIDDISLVYDK